MMRFLLFFIDSFFHPQFIGGLVKAVAGPVIGGLLGSKGQSDANTASQESVREQIEFQKEANQKQMDFQERMANSSYQRGIKDMKRAGLNPMLAYSQGGAHAPSGATSSGASMKFENELAPIANSASKLNMQYAAVQNTNADTALKQAEADASMASAEEIRARTPTHASHIELNKAQVGYITQQGHKILADIDLTNQQTMKVMSEINNIVKSGKLIDAQTEHQLASAGLTRAQIAKVVPEINKLISETARNKAILPFDELRGDYSDMLNVPKNLHRDMNSSNNPIHRFGRWLGGKAADFEDYVKNPPHRRYSK